MTSPRKYYANRANSRLSTGPKTAAGRARSAQNARRHGLAIPVLSDPTLSTEAKTLAEMIFEKDASSELHELAGRIAAAQIDLARVRQARHNLIAEMLAEPNFQTHAAMRADAASILRFLRLADAPGGEDLALPTLAPKPTGPDKLAAILSELSAQLFRLDRYERRALSRRKFAVREFDAVRVSSNAS